MTDWSHTDAFGQLVVILNDSGSLREAQHPTGLREAVSRDRHSENTGCSHEGAQETRLGGTIAEDTV